MAEKNVRTSTQLGMTRMPGRHIRLICLTGNNKGTSYYLIGQRILMGRGKGVDIEVDDSNASLKHAEFVFANKEIVITDLKSQNGLFVNDRKTAQSRLQDGDTIVIGKTVYKFNDIFNKNIIQEKTEDEDESEQEEEGEEEAKSEESPKKKKKPLALIAGIAILYFLISEEEAPKREPSSIVPIPKENTGVTTLDRETSMDAELKNKLDTFIHRGVREYREGNYFRAIAEFDMAATLNPTDGRAAFYRRKASDKISDTIENLFTKATRQRDALKYRSAIVSLCEIVKLLVNYEDEEKEKQATDMLKEIQKQMGVEYGEDYCLTK